MEDHFTEADKLYSSEEQQSIKDDGYKAHAKSLDMRKGNPYSEDDCRHWLWRRGYLEAFKDSNGI